MPVVTLFTVAQIIIVRDTIKPALALAPSSISVQCIEDVPVPTSLSWSDNCDAGGLVLGVDGPLVGGACSGTITRTWNVMDSCMNSAETRTQIITVNDTIDPEIVDVVDYELAACAAEWPDFLTTTWSDNCSSGGSINSDAGVDKGSSTDGSIEYREYTFTVKDDCDNTATETTLVSKLIDFTPPEIECPQAVEVQCRDDIPQPDINSVIIISGGEGGELTIQFVSDVSDNGSCPEIITRTYSASDACGNIVYCSQIIIVRDTIKPALALAPSSISVQCIEDVPVPTSLSWSDNCDAGGLVLGVDGPLVGGACSGTITRTWNVMDSCMNSAETRTQIITVNDTIDPEIVDVVDYELAACAAEWPDFLTTTWSDNCSSGGSINSDAGVDKGSSTDGSIEYREYTFTVKDDCDNTATETTLVSKLIILRLRKIECPQAVEVQCRDDIPQPDINSVIIISGGEGGELTIQFVSDVSDNGSCPRNYNKNI